MDDDLDSYNLVKHDSDGLFGSYIREMYGSTNSGNDILVVIVGSRRRNESRIDVVVDCIVIHPPSCLPLRFRILVIFLLCYVLLHVSSCFFIYFVMCFLYYLFCVLYRLIIALKRPHK